MKDQNDNNSLNFNTIYNKIMEQANGGINKSRIGENTAEGVEEVQISEHIETVTSENEQSFQNSQESTNDEKTILVEEGDFEEVEFEKQEDFEKVVEVDETISQDSQIQIDSSSDDSVHDLQDQKNNQEDGVAMSGSGENNQGNEKVDEVTEEVIIDNNVQDSFDVQEIPEDAFDVVADMSRIATYGLTPRAINDNRIDPTAKPSGTISQFRSTIGGVDLIISTTETTVESGMYTFQGKAKADFILTGKVLDVLATVSLVSSFDSQNIVFMDSSITGGTTPTTVTASLRDFMIKAANEMIDDINGVRTNLSTSAPSHPAGIPEITHRAQLARALRAIFESNTGSYTGGIPNLMFTFKDVDDISPKQVTVLYDGESIFPDSMDYLRSIIAEDSLVNNAVTNNVRTTTTSNMNLNAEGMAVRFDIKNPEDYQAFEKMKTNTNYQFVALNKNVTYYSDPNTKSVVNYLEGFSMTNFKTGKQLPLFETYKVDNSTLTAAEMIYTHTNSTPSAMNIDFNSIDDTTYFDYEQMISTTASNIALRTNGNSVRFNTLKIFDKDKTITKMEVEDDRLNKYPASVALIDTDKPERGGYLHVTGLERSTPYTFRKLHVTAKPEEKDVTKTIFLSQIMTSSISGTTTVTTVLTHTLSIRTSNFTEPKLYIELDPEKKYVNTTSGMFTSTVSGSDTVEVFYPKLNVELPNKLVMPAVKNDKTALRYVIEVDNSDVTIKDLTVNGLKGDEKFKVERIEGKDKIYFILTLYNLSEKRDYGFLILELSYVDIDKRELVTRQVLNTINKITNISIATAPSAVTGVVFTTTGIHQVPGVNLDNETGPELTGTDAFNVTLFDAKTLEARKAEIPVLVDDLNDRFVRIDFQKPANNPNVELVLEGGLLKFTNLEPKTETVYKLDFIWRDKDNKEQTLSKYAKITTPQASSVDVKGTTITTTDTTAEIVFELFSNPQSKISSVALNNESIKFTWDVSTLTLRLSDLKPMTEYNSLEITFKLENGLLTRYKINTFTTKPAIEPPTGKVAEFVSKIYLASLGRQPEVEGWKFWVQRLESKELTVTQFIYGLMKQDEFINRYLNKEDFIKMMYQIVVGRDPEEEGQKYWIGKYDEYRVQLESLADLRIKIASEMMNESEFKQYVASMGLAY
ncbi:hypothetical protein RATSFB_0872 [Candidatus Arthromitus sp. SFB-rat-Yit]|nr:hypothetical protein RATSFB_0872 [Candidatus Arthromitus sp. SFB-rat-Yit]